MDDVPDLSAYLSARWAGSAPCPNHLLRHISHLVANGMMKHRQAVTWLQNLRRNGAQGACAAFIDAWPGSLDILELAYDLDDDAEARADIADHIAAITEQTRQKYSILARVWVKSGQRHRARAVLGSLNPDADSYVADLALAADLALQDGDFTASQTHIAALRAAGADDRAERLAIRQIYFSGGMRELHTYIMTNRDKLMQQARTLTELFSILISEHDIRGCQELLEAHVAGGGGADAAEVAQMSAALALERSEWGRAAEILSSLPDHEQPWLWAPRRLLLHLKCQLASDDADNARNFAKAALRLHANHQGIRHLARMSALVAGDWSSIEQEAQNGTPTVALARMLLRIGNPDAAMAQVDAVAGDNAFRVHHARAAILAQTGQLDRARKELQETDARIAPDVVDRALLMAELALDARDVNAAKGWIQQARKLCPDRATLWPLRARLSFFTGDLAGAVQNFDAFVAHRAAENPVSGEALRRDPRALFLREACSASPTGLPGPDADADYVSDAVGSAVVYASPGLSADLIRRALPSTRPAPFNGGIPKTLMLYWEGPASYPVERSASAWQHLHPEWSLHRFDEHGARIWMSAHTPDCLPAFDKLTRPAARADLFRLAWLSVEGGVYADVDEYPRAAVDDWTQGVSGVFCIEKGYGTVANNFIAAHPDLPVIQETLEMVRQRIQETAVPLNAWWHTGPAPLTRALARQIVTKPNAAPRLLDAVAYARKISTNLPFPHKRGQDHWRGSKTGEYG